METETIPRGISNNVSGPALGSWAIPRSRMHVLARETRGRNYLPARVADLQPLAPFLCTDPHCIRWVLPHPYWGYSQSESWIFRRSVVARVGVGGKMRQGGHRFVPCEREHGEE